MESFENGQLRIMYKTNKLGGIEPFFEEFMLVNLRAFGYECVGSGTTEEWARYVDFQKNEVK
jgi:hypothetical protein